MISTDPNIAERQGRRSGVIVGSLGGTALGLAIGLLLGLNVLGDKGDHTQTTTVYCDGHTPSVLPPLELSPGE